MYECDKIYRKKMPLSEYVVFLYYLNIFSVEIFVFS